jgi:hypothetical protein
MRPTRPSWKPSGPLHRRSPSHRASDRLTHFIVILSPSDDPSKDFGPSSHHIVSTHLCSVGTPSLSDILLSSCIRTRRGGRPTYTLFIIRSTTIGAQDNGWATIGVSRRISTCYIAHFKGMHHLPAPPSTPSLFTLVNAS